MEQLPTKKHYNLTITEDELGALVQLLPPEESVDTDDINNYRLIQKIKDVQINPIAQSMYFINVYDVTQHYGGDEEGGWYYYTTECIYSNGFSTLSAVKSILYDALIQQFYAALDGADISQDKWMSEEQIQHLLDEGTTVRTCNFDRHGEGCFVSIERAPGVEHDMHRPHYE